MRRETIRRDTERNEHDQPDSILPTFYVKNVLSPIQRDQIQVELLSCFVHEETDCGFFTKHFLFFYSDCVKERERDTHETRRDTRDETHEARRDTRDETRHTRRDTGNEQARESKTATKSDAARVFERARIHRRGPRSETTGNPRPRVAYDVEQTATTTYRPPSTKRQNEAPVRRSREKAIESEHERVVVVVVHIVSAAAAAFERREIVRRRDVQSVQL